MFRLAFFDLGGELIPFFFLLIDHVSLSGPPTHPHIVKTASIGTLGRTRTPMLVSVPNAPDVPETSKMLEDVDNVSTAPPSGYF